MKHSLTKKDFIPAISDIRPCAFGLFCISGKPPSNLYIFRQLSGPTGCTTSAKKLSVFPEEMWNSAGFQSRLISCTNTFHDSKTDCLTKGGNRMTKHGPLPERRFGVGLFGCKPAWKAKSKGRLRCEGGGARCCLMNSLFSIMGDADIFSKSYSSLLLSLNFHFQRRPRKRQPDLTPMYTHRLGFHPVTCWLRTTLPLCETHSPHLKQVSRENTSKKVFEKSKTRVVKTNSTHSLAYTDRLM